MPIRKFTNGRITVRRFTAPGTGTGGGTPAAPVGTSARHAGENRRPENRSGHRDNHQGDGACGEVALRGEDFA